MTLNELLSLVATLGATREAAGVDVFRLETPGFFRRTPPDLWDRQTRLLTGLLQLDRPVYWRLEDPPSAFDDTLRWPEAGPKAWLAPTGLEASEVRNRWLYTGNWLAYVGLSPELPLARIDTCRAKPGDLLTFMATAQLAFLLDSFHDDGDWRIAFAYTAG